MSTPATSPSASPSASSESAPAVAAERARAIEVVGASTHNLKSIDCTIPHGAVTVVTGVSGAGKSSLAFDTIYAEAQRRFVESMSTYVRQFLEQMERPPVDAMRGVLPAVALEAKNSIRNARSTVGTLTEVHDVLRLLFTHLGEVHCPDGHGAVHGRGPQDLADLLVERWQGEKVMLLAALERPKKKANDKLTELVRQGYFRRWVPEDDEDFDDARNGILRMNPSDRWMVRMDPLVIALGRFTPKEESRARLVSAIEDGYRLTGGKIRLLDSEGEVHHFGRALTCETCGARLERPTPALFSFNSPLGACPECQGFGRVTGIDRERVIPDRSKSLEEHPIAPWNTKSRRKHYRKLLPGLREAGVRTGVPYEDLDEEEQELVWSESAGYYSVGKFFARLERKKYKMHVRILLARFRAYETCPRCNGERLRPESLSVTVHGKSVAELSELSVEKLRAWVAKQEWDAEGAATHLLEHLEDRLEVLHRVGLGYLTLGRQARTLSGGEAQRIQLASSLGSGLTGTLYVLDEPTIGLHPRDSEKLLSLLHDLSGRGNTVLVVEHDRTLIEGADHVIDLGPKAGEHGGEVLAQGPVDVIRASETSQTARYLDASTSLDRDEVEARSRAAAEQPRVAVRGARENNLRDLDVEIPLGALTAVTGVSGSGKSTLVENVIHGTYQRSRGTVDVEPGEVDELEGFDELEDVVLVDQRPLGRSSRSNPVTYTKAYDEIRKLFARTPEAKRREISPGHFSFNVDKGRCKECKGTGVQEVDMHFMEPVSVVCEECDGKRFLPHVLSVKLRGRNIYETLEMTVTEAVKVFHDRKRLVGKLQSLLDVGLGYLRLGQATSTLSGGEAQRLKLASFLGSGGKRKKKSKKRKPRLFLFDEPTTGLHLADIDLLHQTLRRLVERGDGVVVVEHATDLVAKADWIVDLGPGGGVRGGELLYCGPMVDFLDLSGPGGEIESPTAEILREHVGWGD